MTKRERHLEAKLGRFIRQYRRKRVAGHDSNDRGYDRRLEQRIRHMSPTELDRLIRGESDR